MMDGLDKSAPNAPQATKLPQKGDERILGDGTFAQRVLLLGYKWPWVLPNRSKQVSGNFTTGGGFIGGKGH